MIRHRRSSATTFATRKLALRIEQLASASGLPLPAYQTDGAAGLDLVAAVPQDKPMRLKPGARMLVPTGLRLALPHGTEAQVRPRSGLALRHGVTVLNSPGTIDADYRGEVQVILVNLGHETFVVRRGERIAQLIVSPVSRARLTAATLDQTARGAGGFGSTGVETGTRLADGTKPMPAGTDIVVNSEKGSTRMARAATAKRSTGRKTAARKPAARKPTARKPATRKAAAKPAAKKTARRPAKKAARPATKPAARKTTRSPAAKKSVARKTSTKTATRSVGAGRAPSRKAAGKATGKTARRAPAPRTSAKSPARKKSTALRGRRS